MKAFAWRAHCGRNQVTKPKNLARYQVPYQFLDIEKDAKARLLVEGALNGAVKIPTVFFPDGSFLTEPTSRQLADKIGLRTKPRKRCMIWRLWAADRRDLPQRFMPRRKD